MAELVVRLDGCKHLLRQRQRQRDESQAVSTSEISSNVSSVCSNVSRAPNLWSLSTSLIQDETQLLAECEKVRLNQV